MLNGLFGIGKAYKKLPPHHNFAELADNIERLADELLNRSPGSFARHRDVVGPTIRAHRNSWCSRLTKGTGGTGKRAADQRKGLS
jgi:hypothetical protein